MTNQTSVWIKKFWDRLFPDDLDMQKYYEGEWKNGKM